MTTIEKWYQETRHHKEEMTTMKIPCPVSGSAFSTPEADAQTALALLAMHERGVHPTTGGGGEERTKVMKPEKFPRPHIDQDSTAEA